MIINHNITAMNTLRYLNGNTEAQGKSMERLSTGLRINRGADDAAGLSISEKMRAQIKGLDQASRNAQDGVSMIQTADGALNETTSILQRMRELSVQASSDTLAAPDRTAITSEMTALNAQVDTIATTTSFNGKTLLDGKLNGTDGNAKLSVGANGTAAETITVNFKAMDSATLGLTAANTDVTDVTKSQATTGFIDTAIQTVSTQRGDLGAAQNRLEHTINSLDSISQNTSTAESRIRDVDMAKEVMNSSKSGILAQAAQAMLAQANQQPQGVLQLLR
ncbi:flagellin [Ectobacillus sp. sgz5001026]|uniref:flagellin N-terminal helical domain-containing protein n=1 Tax=Ectobacillus sp. sgz5001026 TaxID=3242473 RepID=UPI0036D2C558